MYGVKWNDCRSDTFSTGSGVKQGGVLRSQIVLMF